MAKIIEKIKKLFTGKFVYKPRSCAKKEEPKAEQQEEPQPKADQPQADKPEEKPE